MILLLLLACGGQGEVPDAGMSSRDFVPQPGWLAEFVPPEAPDTEPLLLKIAEDGGWELRRGERWADATPQGTWEAWEEGGYWVNGDLLLPERLVVGQTTDDVTVVEVGQATAWYGTFDVAVTVLRDSGRLGNEQVIAQDLGPVILTLDGFRWELAWYE